MKTSCLCLFTIMLLICLGCNDLSKKSEIDSSGFGYTIRGLVTNGEGLVFTLDIPENGDELKAKVENGQFSIKGHEDQIKLARIGIEGSRIFGTIMIEPEECTFKFAIIGDDPDYSFGMPAVVQGERNKLFFKFGEEFVKISEGRNRISPDAMDSLHMLVYPEYRRDIFKLYDKYYAQFDSDLKLISLSLITDRLNQIGPFDKRYFNLSEITKIKNYFSQIDTSLSRYSSYQNVKTITSMLSTSAKGLEFHEYALEGIDGTTHKLSDIVNGNNYTIVDFWHGRCNPCRKFNLEMLPNYADLKASRIEIVGINVDKDKSDWQKCSSQDSIKWKNLHAGISTIEHMYNIRSYPTYIVFDKNLHLVDIVLKDASEVLDWASSIAKR